MGKLKWAAILLAFTAVGVLAQEAEAYRNAKDGEHALWIRQVLLDVSRVKPKMTRQFLSEKFEEDGGLQFRAHGRYVYKLCPYIKVDIEFAAADDGVEESSDDTILKVSRPYLEYPVTD